MPKRTTKNDRLVLLKNEVNRNLGLPQTSYIRDTEGKSTARIGHIYVEKGLNGYCLLQIINVGGGVRNIGSSSRQTYGSIVSTLQALADVTSLVAERLGKTPFTWAE